MFKSSVIYFFYQNILKYFIDFQNQNFSILWQQWTQTMEMKKNQIFFHGPYSNLTSFLIGMKILNYSIDFYNWHASVSLQKWYQASKMKQNQTWYLQVCKHFSLSRKASLYYLNDFWNLSVEKIFLKNEW